MPRPDYKVIRDEEENVWALFRVEADKQTRILSSPKRKTILRAYKRVKGYTIGGKL